MAGRMATSALLRRGGGEVGLTPGYYSSGRGCELDARCKAGFLDTTKVVTTGPSVNVGRHKSLIGKDASSIKHSNPMPVQAKV